MLDVKKMLTKVGDFVGGDSRWTNLNGNVWYKKRLVQYNVVSEQDIRCIAKWIQAHLFGILHQLGKLLCIHQLLERKHRTSVCGKKRQHRNFEQFKHYLECNLHQRHALQVALSEGGCF